MNYFGKGCKHFCGQWEDNNSPFYGNSEPVLTACNHVDNKEREYEGACNLKDCPLPKEGYMKRD